MLHASPGSSASHIHLHSVMCPCVRRSSMRVKCLLTSTCHHCLTALHALLPVWEACKCSWGAGDRRWLAGLMGPVTYRGWLAGLMGPVTHRGWLAGLMGPVTYRGWLAGLIGPVTYRGLLAGLMDPVTYRGWLQVLWAQSHRGWLQVLWAQSHTGDGNRSYGPGHT